MPDCSEVCDEEACLFRTFIDFAIGVSLSIKWVKIRRQAKEVDSNAVVHHEVVIGAKKRGT